MKKKIKDFKKSLKKGKHTKKSYWKNIPLLILIIFLLGNLFYTTYKFIKNEDRIQEVNIHREVLEQEMELKVTEMDELNKHLEEKQKEIDELNQKVTELEQEVESLKTKRTTSATSRGATTSRTSTNEGYMAFIATGYCPCSKCCGGWANGITARGTTAKANYTVAMPSNYSFGTQIEIKGMGIYVVEDRGGAIKGNRIDIYFNSHSEALAFGKKTVYLRVIK